MLDTFLDGSVVALVAGAGASAFAVGMFAGRMRGGRPLDLNFESFVENINEGYYRSSLDGKQMFGNKALVRLNGYQTQQELLDSVNDIATEWYVDPKRRDEFRELLETDGYVENFISEIYRHNTRERIWISENARLVYDSSGNPAYYEGTVREFTDTMKRLELEELHAKLGQQVPGVLLQARWSGDGSFTIPYHSDGFSRILGPLSGNVKVDARFLFGLVHPEDVPKFVSSAEESARNNVSWSSEFRLRREDGREIWVGWNATPEFESNGSCLWHGFLMDITEKKNAEQRIHSLAFYDPLTDLPNRRLLVDRIKQSLKKSGEQGELGALMFIDLDNFKDLNDTRGHGVGDELLVEIARRLRSCVGDEGLVGRFGGDEFIVLMENLGSDSAIAAGQAGAFSKRILAEVEAPSRMDSGVFHPSCSIGVAMIDKDVGRWFDVLKNADTAMYAAKAKGKNQLQFFDAAMRENLETSVELMNDLRDAVGTDQLSLHYQMQVNAQHRVVGAEGLLRWTHPVHGVVPPDRFIPAAEQSGLIIPVTAWVMEQAVTTLARWSKMPTLQDVRLSINISAAQFQEDDFAQTIIALLSEHDVDPERLVLEMTEHVLTGDLDRVKHVMQELREAGVGFSLDDFGTGYSSLSHLRELPFNELKIDGNFVRDIETCPSDRAIVSATIAMAKALGLETVAEWVETVEQRELLVKEGCDNMQGYLFGPAMPRNAFEEAALLPLVADKSSNGRSQHLKVVG